MNADHVLTLVNGKNNLFFDILRFHGSRGDEYDEYRRFAQRFRNFIRPVCTRVNAFVVPDTETFITQAGNVLKDNFRIFMRVADENIGFVSFVCIKWRYQALYHHISSNNASHAQRISAQRRYDRHASR